MYFLGAIVVVYNLVVMSFKLIKRIFSIIVLYLTAPVYVARMVDDGGVKFKEWKNSGYSYTAYFEGVTVDVYFSVNSNFCFI